MSTFNSCFRFNLNKVVLFCQKPRNGQASLLKNQPYILLKVPVRNQNIHVSPFRKNSQKNPFGIGGLFLLLIPVTSFGLGAWQIKRLKWKEELIEKLKSKTSATPIEFPSDLSELEDLEYRKVRVQGRFDHANEIFYGPKTCLIDGQDQISGINKTGEGSFGYLLITPFILSDSGQRILVNRGWIKTKDKKPVKRPTSFVQDEQTIVGIVRHNEQTGKFTPKHNSKLRIFYSRDIDGMAEECNTLPVFLDATEESSIPGVVTAGQTRIHLRNEHLSYIITWFSLSLATSIMWYRFFIHR